MKLRFQDGHHKADNVWNLVLAGVMKMEIISCELEYFSLTQSTSPIDRYGKFVKV